MRNCVPLLLLASLVAAGCGGASEDAPPGGWANAAPTTVETVVDRGAHQLLEVRQGSLTTWVQVPAAGARVGDYVLLGRGTARANVPIPERSLRAPEVVDIAHVRVVDAETARRFAARTPPSGAVPVATVYTELDRRADASILVFGRAVRVANAVGYAWVHLQDGTGESAAGTHDLTVQTRETVAEGQWVAFRGTLRRDVDLGFGYHYDALVEGGTRVE